MIIFIYINLSELIAQGKAYNFPRPEKCPDCSHPKLHVHSYVERFFDFSKERVFLQKLRCPGCYNIHTLRPENYLPYVTYSIYLVTRIIYKYINNEIIDKQYRAKARYWHKKFQTFIRLYFPGQETLLLLNKFRTKKIISWLIIDKKSLEISNM
jgi:hypothetical protein